MNGKDDVHEHLEGVHEHLKGVSIEKDKADAPVAAPTPVTVTPTRQQLSLSAEGLAAKRKWEELYAKNELQHDRFCMLMRGVFEDEGLSVPSEFMQPPTVPPPATAEASGHAQPIIADEQNVSLGSPKRHREGSDPEGKEAGWKVDVTLEKCANSIGLTQSVYWEVSVHTGYDMVHEWQTVGEPAEIRPGSSLRFTAYFRTYERAVDLLTTIMKLGIERKIQVQVCDPKKVTHLFQKWVREADAKPPSRPRDLFAEDEEKDLHELLDRASSSGSTASSGFTKTLTDDDVQRECLIAMKFVHAGFKPMWCHIKPLRDCNAEEKSDAANRLVMSVPLRDLFRGDTTSGFPVVTVHAADFSQHKVTPAEDGMCSIPLEIIFRSVEVEEVNRFQLRNVQRSTHALTCVVRMLKPIEERDRFIAYLKDRHEAVYPWADE